jgi:hypothetical protein
VDTARAGEKPDPRLRQAEARVIAATMMSHASAISRPPPTATPLTAAIIGFGSRSRA